MKKYLSNPELKRSNAILFAILLSFFLIVFFAQRQYYQEMKMDYVKSLGAITAKVIEKDPSMEQKIVPFITKEVSDQDARKGEAVLKQYGLSENLESSLFPYYKTTFAKNSFSFLVLFVALCSILFSFNYFQYRIFYERVRNLTIAAKKVVEGEYHFHFQEYQEGDFSKLVSSFHDMRKIIRSNIHDLQKEKSFLVHILSDISHQLKTPLSSLIVYNDILLSKELTKEQQKTFLTNTHHQLLRMKNLINNLLKLAKLDAKAIEFEKIDESLNDTIQEAIDTLESKASEEMVQICYQYSEEIMFNHDKLWLQEALINIIKNAIEHSFKKGKIHIQLMQNPIYIRLMIEDGGTGIEEEDLPHIFNRFYKARNSKNSDSVGIGLALAKSIIEGHHGVIEVESRLNKGTKFTITFLKY